MWPTPVNPANGQCAFAAWGGEGWIHLLALSKLPYPVGRNAQKHGDPHGQKNISVIALIWYESSIAGFWHAIRVNTIH